MDLYKSMMTSLGEANINDVAADITVEIAERECVTEKSIYLRVAFQETGNLEEIEFLNREQLLSVGKAIWKYFDNHGGVSQILK